VPLSQVERWADIPHAPGYQASTEGRVRSLDRTLTDGRTAGGVLLRQRRDRKGYWCVSLVIAGERKTLRVHLLVKVAHTGPPRGRQVRHKDDDKDNNRLSNLKYGTARQNAQDRERNRRRREGEKERGRKGKEKRGRNKEEKQLKQAEGSRVPAIVSGCFT
jgi:NUMOD4 motif/HNH endonuclease